MTIKKKVYKYLFVQLIICIIIINQFDQILLKYNLFSTKLYETSLRGRHTGICLRVTNARVASS